MSRVIGPTYALEDGMAETFGIVATVLDTPVVAMALAEALLGDPVLFDQGAGPHDIAVPIPHLPGLDEIELTWASFFIASAPFGRSQAVSGENPGNAAVGIVLDGVAPGQTVNLTGLTLTGLAATPPADISYALTGTGGTVYWMLDEGELVSSTTNPGGTVQHLHILIRPGTGSAAGPPIAAAPHFNMPGAAVGLYGPALGSTGLSLLRQPDGQVNATLTLTPAQPMSACTLMVGTAAEGGAAIGAHGGLPTDLVGVDWSATTVEGRFDTRAQGIMVTTHAGATAPAEGALVASFDTDPGSAPREVNFAPAARAALEQGYPTATGPDLGLTLRVQVIDTPGALYLQLGSVGARYVQRPFPLPASLSLRGAPETVRIPLPTGLRPQGLSFRVDGRYGPARLTADADAAPESSRQGYRIAGPQQAARRLLLNPKETVLPLARLALYGRASEDGEVLITRHGGDQARIGPALGPPVSLLVSASDTPAWQRVDIPLRDGLPPHAEALWVTVQATKGVFWWHADMGAALPASQTSADGGVTWTSALGRPLTQAWVLEVDPASGDPAPLAPLALGWEDGVLNSDIVGVGAAAPAPDFTRLWVAEGAGNAALLDGIAGLPGPLALRLNSTRDVDLSLTDVVLIYGPWSAGGTP